MSLKIAVVVTLVVVLVADLCYKGIWSKTSLIGYQHLMIMALLLFVGFHEKIAKLVLSKRGPTIEQKLDVQVKEVQDTAQSLAFIENGGDLELVNILLTRSECDDKDVWSRLILYRWIIRALLRRPCFACGMPLDDTSLSTMITFIEQKSVLPADLIANIEFVREGTYLFEWGTGRVPSSSEVRLALDMAPRIIRQLVLLYRK